MTAAGTDVGKASLDLALEGHAGATGFSNSRVGIAELVKHLKRLGAKRIVVEAHWQRERRDELRREVLAPA